MKRLSLWITLILALVSVVGVYFYITSAIEAQNNEVKKTRPETPEQALQISVMNVEMGAYAAEIKASGLVEPRYSLTLTNQVSGQVTQLSSQFESGQVIKKGHVLATLTNKELNSEVASARNTLASAELALKEEQRQGEQARAEWEASGFDEAPDSDLVLREPQLAAAQAEFDSAKAELESAQNDLKNVKLIAPFDALVVERLITPGSYLRSTGSDIGTLYSTDRAEIQIDLSSSDWLKLPDTNILLSSDWPVTIQSIEDGATWQGKILHVGLHIDETTRMRSLTIGLDQPLAQSPQLIPGAFVSVSLKGKELNNLWRLPNTALSQKSEIWFLDKDNRLDTFATTPRFVDSNYVYIQAPEDMKDGNYQVLMQPYNSYIKGTLVDPIIVSNQEKQSTVKGNNP
ncbi:RND transporter [Marinomonas ushuaiensis DSM 15871]|uniref:RND transporter n=1 Tax=Marinomonas ushuaiensis DSM 15871 TaxID=1122207 RepID=X7E5R2_9GAMM|nr:efflux RND transporter periplasmic adaptor subunit [Marinomonas ushuaiensis]ETX11297.1 RND transporter [Marinomonas ushuaiensis DSM 15871]